MKSCVGWTPGGVRGPIWTSPPRWLSLDSWALSSNGGVARKRLEDLLVLPPAFERRVASWQGWLPAYLLVLPPALERWVAKSEVPRREK